MRRLGIFVAAVGLIAGLYLGLHKRPRRGAIEQSGARAVLAPKLEAFDLSGNKIDTSAYQGKVVLVNFWAAWCTSCADEIPQFVALQEKYGAEGLQTIGISMDDQEAALREFCRKYKINYPIVEGTQKTAQQFGGVLGLPTTFLIGRDGRIRAKHAGPADIPALEREIVDLLRTGG